MIDEGGTTMTEQSKRSAAPQAGRRKAGRETTRRRFLEASAALAAGGTAGLPAPAAAQGAADAELARVQRERRILLKGGVVLTLDRQVGDFARADVLIEDGKIREVGPNIAVPDDAAAVVDASNRILIPGFIDT